MLQEILKLGARRQEQVSGLLSTGMLLDIMTRIASINVVVVQRIAKKAFSSIASDGIGLPCLNSQLGVVSCVSVHRTPRTPSDIVAGLLHFTPHPGRGECSVVLGHEAR